MRIRKAMEWGAVWIREFKDGISHVIVDKDLNYKDVLSFLKIQSLPVSFLPLRTKAALKFIGGYHSR